MFCIDGFLIKERNLRVIDKLDLFVYFKDLEVIKEFAQIQDLQVMKKLRAN